ncbi:hypothetical protein LCGC14_0683550 [marine sediment metagenome]|uniref:Uncharacterized protein n=1 Tax=marine sediment metagenome TaxID=412755 RepID=A0A0F9QSH1_9ZZZZ
MVTRTRYRGREFKMTIGAPTREDLKDMIFAAEEMANENNLEYVEVVAEYEDPDGGWEAIIIAHNFNPFKWIKDKAVAIGGKIKSGWRARGGGSAERARTKGLKTLRKKEVTAAEHEVALTEARERPRREEVRRVAKEAMALAKVKARKVSIKEEKRGPTVLGAFAGRRGSRYFESEPVAKRKLTKGERKLGREMGEEVELIEEEKPVNPLKEAMYPTKSDPLERLRNLSRPGGR